MHNCTLQVMTDERRKLLSEGDKNISASDCGIVLDLKDMDRVVEVDTVAKSITVESGISIEKIRGELEKHGLELQCLPQSNLGYDETTLSQVIAEDALCVESRSKGFFRDNGVERISFFSGDGEAI